MLDIYAGTCATILLTSIKFSDKSLNLYNVAQKKSLYQIPNKVVFSSNIIISQNIINTCDIYIDEREIDTNLFLINNETSHNILYTSPHRKL